MRYLSFFILCCYFGISSQIHAQPVSSPETGYASYIANYLDGRKTAYGEIYNKNKLTAAHRTYPLGTFLRVTRLDNDKTIIVRVNDKGPFDPSRVIDVSFAAAEALDLVYDGIAMVKVEVVDENGNPIAFTPPTSAPSQAPPVYNQVEVPISYDYKPQLKETATPTTATSTIPAGSTLPGATPPAPPYLQDLQPKTPLAETQPKSYDTPAATRIATGEPGSGFFVQLGAFSKRENAESLINRLSARGINNVQIHPSGQLFKTLVGPFDNATAANQSKQQISQELKVTGFVTRIE